MDRPELIKKQGMTVIASTGHPFSVVEIMEQDREDFMNHLSGK